MTVNASVRKNPLTARFIQQRFKRRFKAGIVFFRPLARPLRPAAASADLVSVLA
jgi:hypothetical protein